MSASEAVDGGLAYLESHMLPNGELPSYAGFLDDPDMTWEPDRLSFVTALGVEMLNCVPDPRAVRMVDLCIAFLRGQQERGGVWRYWSSDHDRHEFTPPDADDTACASLALGCRGIDTTANRSVLLACRDPAGAFRTWLIPHRPWRTPGAAWVLRNELRSTTRKRREVLWSDTEADPGDVDAVVGANVCRYLGPDAPRAAVEHVVDVVRRGAGSGDKWHRSPFSLWAAVAGGAYRGVPGFRAVGPLVLERLADALGVNVEADRDLDTALGLLTMVLLGGPAHLRESLNASLVARQRSDGSWARDVVYYGGPSEVFGWASESLTTAVAISALSMQARSHS